MSKEILEKLMAAREASTKGTWHVEYPMEDIEISIVVDGPTPEAYDWRFIARTSFDGPEDAYRQEKPVTRDEADANAAFITLSHTSLPAVAEWVEGLEREKANLDALQDTVGKWGAETFPRSSNGSIVNHLREEVEELAESGDPSEAADCLLMLLHFAHRNGFSLFDEALKKHLYVREHYVFGEPDENGVSRHIKAPSETEVRRLKGEQRGRTES